MDMETNNQNELNQNQTNSSEINNFNESNVNHSNPEDSGNSFNEFHSGDAAFSNDQLHSSTAQKDSYEEEREMKMDDFSEKENSRVNNKMENRNGKRYVRGFVSTVAAGVVGSVLTLAVLPHTNYLQNFYANGGNQSGYSSTQTVSPVKAVSAQPTSASSSAIADTVEKVSKAIVGIENYQNQQSTDFFGNSTSSQSVDTGSGSGVIFQRNNDYAYIVTNNHVVEGASKLVISLYDGSKTTAQLVGTDALSDLAVLKISAKDVQATAQFGDSASLRPGDQVYAIGNPLGLDLSRTVTEGIVSATNRSVPVSTSAGNYETNVIQTDAAINPGNSGGALINPQGLVVGINSMKISETGVEGIGFAIPSDDAIPIVNQLIKYGKIQRPYLGVGLADLNQVPQGVYQNLPNNFSGAVVVNIDPNSAADKAGFKPKDIITAMNGTKITNSTDLRRFLYTKVHLGDSVKFDVYRDGKQITLTAKLTNTASNS